MTAPQTSQGPPLTGQVANSSETPPTEVGGLALLDGVLMRSRTGFATARRLADGRIHLTQVPLPRRASPLGVLLHLPILRGLLALGDIVTIGTRALVPAAGAPPRRRAMLLGLALALAVLLLLVLPSTGAALLAAWWGWSMPLALSLLDGALRIAILVLYLMALGLIPDVRRLFAWHGAEHMAVWALEQGRDVTVGRAAAHPPIHPRCGTVMAGLLVVLAVVGFAIGDALAGPGLLAGAGVRVLLLPVLVGVSFECVRWAARHRRLLLAKLLLAPGLALQHLTTRRPDAAQLEVAIVALFAALDLPPGATAERTWMVRGLEDDDSAPGFRPRSPARPAHPA